MPKTRTPPATAVVVNDYSPQLEVLCWLVQEAGLEPLPFASAEAALAAMNPQAPPALIVTDLYMPGIDGWRFCRLLRSPEYLAFNQVPILVVSATFAGDYPERIAADIGANAFLPVPVDRKAFVAQVQALVGGKETRRQPTVLIVEDELNLAGLLVESFVAHGYRADMAPTAREAEKAFAQTAYDLAVLDYHLPDGTGDALLDAFRTRRPDCACVVMTGDSKPELALDWMKRGASAYLRKPFEPSYLIELCIRARRERALLRAEDLLEARTRELRDEHRRQEHILEGTGAGTWEWNVRTGEAICNERWAEIVGYTLAELSPVSIKTWETLAHPEDLKLSGERLERHFAGELPYYDCECRMRHKDGSWVWVRDHGKVNSWTADGKPQWISGTHVDITKRKRAEQARDETDERLRSILRAAPTGIGVVINRMLSEVNARVGEMTGYTPEELIGQSARVLYPTAEEFECVGREKYRQIAEHGTGTVETRWQKKDGSIIDVLLSSTPIEPADLTRGVTFTALDITKRKLAEEAIKASEANYRAFFESMEDMVVVGTTAGRVLYANDAIRKKLGYSLEELDALGILGLHPADRRKEAEEIFAAMIRGERSSCPLPVRRKNGALMPVETRVSFGKWSGQDCVFGIIKDLTAEQEAQQRFERLFRHNPALMALSSLPERRFVDVNDTFLKTLGYERAEVIGKTPAELGLFPDVGQQEAVADQLAAEERVTDVELRVRRKDGALLDGLFSGELIASQEQRYFLTVMIDMTERKRAEAALRLDEERLEVLLALNNMTGAGERELTHFAMEAAVRLTNSTIGYVAFMNEDETVLTMQAWSEQAMRECAIADRPIEYPIATTGLWGEAVRQRKAVITNNYAAPNPWKKGTPEGHVRVTRHMNNPTLDGGRTVIVAGVGNKPADYGDDDVRQISLLMSGLWTLIRRKRGEEERERLQAQLTQAQKMESVGRLAGGVAHDFNNMLQAILGNTALALLELPPESPVRESLEEIQQCAQRSADLTRQLLAFARKQTIAPKVLDLNETVTGMLKMLRRLIGEDIDLAWLPGAGLGLVNVDPSQVDQVLANLCVNARDAIGGGVGKVTIETANADFDAAYVAEHPETRAGKYVRLAVSDNGCGMGPEVKAHLFEPFFTTKGLGQGTGLGLATVYGIVKQNHGIINVYSEPGRGTTFQIHLPRYAARAASPAGEAPLLAPVRGHETILLVEDEPSLLRVSQRVLEKLGYRILAACTPGEAMQLAREHAGEIHLLLTDVVMPEMNGRDLAKNLLSQYPNLKRLFMSGYTANVIAHHGVLDPGVHFIQKPFSVRDLADKVREALDQE